MAPDRLIELKRTGTCRHCGAAVAAGDRAWWAWGRPTVVCLRCRPEAEPIVHAEAVELGSESGADRTGERPPLTATSVVDEGVAGGSARREFERRHAQREERIRAKWGRLATVVLLVTEDPQSTRAWAKGALGESKLADSLARLRRDDIVVLHDRKVPGTRGNIDHLVIAPTGVHVVDAKLYKGEVRIEDVGGVRRRDERLYVGGRDHSKLADAMVWQVDDVKQALCDDAIPVLPVLCFIDAEWPLFAAPSQFRGVLIEGKRSIGSRVSAKGPLDREAILTIASRLAAALPAAIGSPRQAEAGGPPTGSARPYSAL